MTDEQLKSLCKLWQKRLRLQDWRIDVRLVDSGELGNSEGGCRAFRDDKLAIIKVLKPDAVDRTDDYFKAFPETYSVERILVHELLHIPLEGILNPDANDHEKVAEEQAVNQITNALVEAYSGERR
jgi:hypothetical protein